MISESRVVRKFERWMLEVKSWGNKQRNEEIKGVLLGTIIDDRENKTEIFVPATGNEND